MHIFFEFLINLLKTLLQVFAKSCADKNAPKPEINQKKRGHKRTTSISKTTTENFQIETFSTSADSPDINAKKET